MKKTRILAIILFIAIIMTSAMALYSCADKNTLGKGATSFKLEITDKDGKTETYTIKTDEKTVGDALKHTDVKLLTADASASGFDTVNGMKADYTADGAYWEFFIDGVSATDSAFNTDVVKDAKYAFKYTIYNPDAIG